MPTRLPQSGEQLFIAVGLFLRHAWHLRGQLELPHETLEHLALSIGAEEANRGVVAALSEFLKA